mmetsp:Transcript_63912/g.128221  ORF Transcript_63912/g.128221 Transcript_63912/m.128221 type:complete len:295 (+) Transcript_63912:304-1188(+)
MADAVSRGLDPGHPGRDRGRGGLQLKRPSASKSARAAAAAAAARSAPPAGDADADAVDGVGALAAHALVACLHRAMRVAPGKVATAQHASAAGVPALRAAGGRGLAVGRSGPRAASCSGHARHPRHPRHAGRHARHAPVGAGRAPGGAGRGRAPGAVALRGVVVVEGAHAVVLAEALPADTTESGALSGAARGRTIRGRARATSPGRACGVAPGLDLLGGERRDEGELGPRLLQVLLGHSVRLHRLQQRLVRDRGRLALGLGGLRLLAHLQGLQRARGAGRALVVDSQGLLHRC